MSTSRKPSAETSNGIIADIVNRVRCARGENRANFWAWQYNADVQFLLGKLQASQERVSLLELQNQKLKDGLQAAKIYAQGTLKHPWLSGKGMSTHCIQMVDDLLSSLSA